MPKQKGAGSCCPCRRDLNNLYCNMKPARYHAQSRYPYACRLAPKVVNPSPASCLVLLILMQLIDYLQTAPDALF